MNTQRQSPLFGIIPAEIRNEIFDLALQWYDDTEKPYAGSRDFDYCSRPGFRGPQKIDLALLRTCKRVYEETKALPLKNLQLVYYMGYWKRAPSEFRNTGNRHEVCADIRMQKLKMGQLSKISRVHIFTQMYAFKPFAMYTSVFGYAHILCPKIVTITIRYTDWWNWELDAPLCAESLRPNPKGIYFPESVEKLVMELETREGKKKELESIIEGMRNWEYLRIDDETLKMAKDEPVREWTWDGPTVFEKGVTFSHHPDGEKMKYVVKVLTWGVGNGSS